MSLTLLQKLAITGDIRRQWYEALAKTTKGDLPLFEVLGKMQGEFDKIRHPLAPLVRELLFRLKGLGSDRQSTSGGRRTLGSELRGLVPDGEAMLIQSGVSSGNTTAGLLSAADVVAKQGRLMNAMVASLVKPVGYFAALIGLLVFFSVKVFPSMQRGRPRTKWPAEAQLFGWVADHIWWITGGTLGFLAAITVVVIMLAPRWVGPRREWCDLHLFPFTLIANMNGSSLLNAVASYISSGIAINVAIANIRGSATPYLRWQCDKLTGLIAEGQRPEAALTELSVIHPQHHWIIKVYGMDGDATQAYKTIAESLTESTEVFIRRLFGYWINNALIATVAIVLMWILMSLAAIVDSGTKKFVDSGAHGAALASASFFAAPSSTPGDLVHVS